VRAHRGRAGHPVVMRFFAGEQHVDTVRHETMMSRVEAVVLVPGDAGYPQAMSGARLDPAAIERLARDADQDSLRLLGWGRLRDWTQDDGSIAVVLPRDEREPLRLSLDELAGLDSDTTLIRASMHSVPLWRFDGGDDPFGSSEQRWLRLVQD
jgi:hypothetical protein